MSLLDTVEPDAWRYQTVRNTYRYRGVCHNFGIDYKLLKPVGLLTVPHVEFLLSQCRKEARKEALLEAAEVCGKLSDTYDANAGKYQENEAHWIVRSIGADDCKDELRRMAEGEK